MSILFPPFSLSGTALVGVSYCGLFSALIFCFSPFLFVYLVKSTKWTVPLIEAPKCRKDTSTYPRTRRTDAISALRCDSSIAAAKPFG